MTRKLSTFLAFVMLLACALHAQALTQLSSCLGLQAIRTNLAESYELISDIDCSVTSTWNAGQGFDPIGNSTFKFTGIFDGQNYRIFDLFINRTSTNRVGLFGDTDTSAQIRSVGLEGGSVTGADNTGGLVGYNRGTIAESYTTADIVGASDVGGLAGENQFGSITNSYATGMVSASGNSVGGLVGMNRQGISGCYATGSVVGAGRVGGLVGENWPAEAIISNSYATGMVSGSESKVGGLVGENERGTISNSYATGNVTSSDWEVGGLVGYNDYGIILNSYAIGDVTSLSRTVGGFVGSNNQGTISNCYSRGNVEGASRAVAGLVGDNNFGTISNSYATGIVSGSGLYFGGLVGENDGSIVNGYWDIQTSGQTTSAGGVGKTTAEMQQQITFAGWDFAGTWFMTSGYTYPLLQLFVLPPTLPGSLLDQSHNIGELFVFSIVTGIFVDPNGLVPTYSAHLTGGLPLPAWLFFTSGTQLFAGTPFSGAQDTLTIDVTACNLPIHCVTDTFTLEVLNRSPFVQAAIPQQVAVNRVLFQFIVPSGAFADLDNDHLLFTATAIGGGALPVWLIFNPSLGIFSGVPTSRGNEWVNLTASDGFGGQASLLFEIVTPNSAPEVASVFPNQVAVIAQPFNFNVPTNSFFDLDSDPLTYSASLFGGGELFAWLNFNPLTLTFSGTPDTLGFLVLSVTATDIYNATTSMTFGLSVSDLTGNTPPLLAIKQLDQTTQINELFELTLPEDMFDDPDGNPLTYSATLEGGVSLPVWLNFTASSRTFSGVPPAASTLRITVRADDGLGGFSLDTFTLSIEDATNQPPALLNPLSNQVVSVGQRFQFTVPLDTFRDPNDDLLIYNATRSGKGSLPGWLKFDPATRTFSGKPDNTDTDTYTDRTHLIEVRASDGEGSAVTVFQLSVSGESQGEQAITALLIIASIASTVFGVYRNRAFLWNTFAKKKYQKPDQVVALGQEFRYQFDIPAEQIGLVQAFKNGEPLPNYQRLPPWLENDFENITSLLGTPQKNGTFILSAFAPNGCILESFTLRCGNGHDSTGKDVEMATLTV